MYTPGIQVRVPQLQTTHQPPSALAIEPRDVELRVWRSGSDFESILHMAWGV